MKTICVSLMVIALITVSAQAVVVVNENFDTSPADWVPQVDGASTWATTSGALSGRAYADNPENRFYKSIPTLSDTQDFDLTFDTPFTLPYDRYVGGPDWPNYATAYTGMFNSASTNSGGGMHFEMLAYSWSDGGGFHWDFQANMPSKTGGAPLYIRTEAWHWGMPNSADMAAQIKYTAATRELQWSWGSALETYVVPAGYTFDADQIGVANEVGIPAHYLTTSMDNVLLTVVPEPATLGLLVMGGLGLLSRRTRKA